MGKIKKYPVLIINRKKIFENAKVIVELCNEKGISISGVIKGVNGISAIAEEFLAAGCEYISSSRVEQLVDLRKKGIMNRNMLIRIPMKSEIAKMVKYVDISLNSEWVTVDCIEASCRRQNRIHSVVLMVDLGDLREGFFDQEELIALAMHIEKDLEHVKIIGIGTNLGCYGSVKPTVKNLGELVGIAKRLENILERKLEIVSGGATISLSLLLEGKMPEGINNLRIGEGMLLNMDLPNCWKIDIPGMNQETMILQAQIVEVKTKPSHPIGELFKDAFENRPKYPYRGYRKRALLAVGKQDFVMNESLVPVDKDVQVIGSSSDHLIVEIDDSKIDYKVGDIMDFKMYYVPMLYLCTSEWVQKIY